MSDLFAPVCSIAATRRRRFIWAAWWTGPPSRDPFKKPDAFEGGARTREEALAEAERAAGMPLVVIEPHWAAAWARVLLGQPPWLGQRRAETTGRGPAPSDRASVNRASVWAILGVSAGATEAELKRAFRKRALEVHPDHGGDASAFRDLKRAYDEARLRVKKPKRSV